jgi:hypothetical protein
LQTCTPLFNTITDSRCFSQWETSESKRFTKKVHGGSWSLSQQDTFERAIFLPRWETIGVAATHWTEWEDFLKKETRMVQPWHHHHCHPWHCDTPHSPDDQAVDHAVWMGGVSEFFAQTRLIPLDFNFIDLSKKSLAVGLVIWLHALDSWHRFHCEVHQCVPLGCMPQ